jgi:hypothetical protein
VFLVYKILCSVLLCVCYVVAWCVSICLPMLPKHVGAAKINHKLIIDVFIDYS